MSDVGLLHLVGLIHVSLMEKSKMAALSAPSARRLLSLCSETDQNRLTPAPDRLFW